MLKGLLGPVLTSLVAFACFVQSPANASQPERVLVVYNSNWPTDGDGDGLQDSQQVANYYAAKRAIPAVNVLGLACSTGASFYYASYTNFYNDIIVPLKNKLSSLGPNNIDVILVCYGVPFQVPNSSGAGVSLDNALMALNYWSATTANIGRSANPYLESNPTFGTDKGHFDHATYKFAGTHMYLVTRLDARLRPAP